MIITKRPAKGFRTDKKILIECDFKSSPKCKGQYYKLYKNVIRCQNNNNGNDRCQYCFNSLTKRGEQNYNFKYKKEPNYFSAIDTELKAYFLGWVAGDGHLKKDGLHFSVHPIDIGILILFRDSVSPDSKITYRKDDNTVNLKIFSVQMLSDLCKHLKLKGPGKKSYVITLPDLSDDLMWPFIRGLFDSDGSIQNILSKSTSPQANISSMSNIKYEIANFCNKYNIKNSISKTMIHFWGKNVLLFLDKVYLGSSYSLTRKRCLYKMWSTWKPHYGTLFRSRKIRDGSTYNLKGLTWNK